MLQRVFLYEDPKSFSSQVEISNVCVRSTLVSQLKSLTLKKIGHTLRPPLIWKKAIRGVTTFIALFLMAYLGVDFAMLAHNPMLRM